MKCNILLTTTKGDVSSILFKCCHSTAGLILLYNRDIKSFDGADHANCGKPAGFFSCGVMRQTCRQRSGAVKIYQMALLNSQLEHNGCLRQSERDRETEGKKLKARRKREKATYKRGM